MGCAESRTECVRLKNYVVNAEITGNSIKYCGVYDFAFNEGGKNGEGIYIGTSSTQVTYRSEGSTVHAITGDHS